MRRRHVTSTLTNALAALAPQLIALILLPPDDFGNFSFTYLAYALGISLSLSIVAEPWHLRSLDGKQSNWSDFAVVSAILAVVLGLLAWLAEGMLDSSRLLGPVAAIAIAAGIFRASARYYLIQQDRAGRANAFDMVFAGLLVCSVILILFFKFDLLLGIYLGWSAAGLGSLFLLPRVSLADASPHTWLQRHSKHIRRLLSDSIMMDVGSIFTPALIAPALGAAAFGIYRAISNVTAPVRLILNPLRPAITEGRDSEASRGSRATMVVLVGGLALALTASATLIAIHSLGLRLGVLNSLFPFIPAVAITLWANFVGHYFYIRARSRFSGRALISTRIAQTTIVSLLPLAGTYLHGLEGAIWSAAAANLLVAALWAWMDRNQRGRLVGSSTA